MRRSCATCIGITGVPDKPAFGLLGWNPVKRRLVPQPDHWMWNSFRACAYRENVHLRVNVQEWELKIKPRKRETFGKSSVASRPHSIAKCAIEWGTPSCVRHPPRFILLMRFPAESIS
jgi:hypothetical protein